MLPKPPDGVHVLNVDVSDTGDVNDDVLCLNVYPDGKDVSEPPADGLENIKYI